VADVSLGVSEVGAHQAIVPVEVPPRRQTLRFISTATIFEEILSNRYSIKQHRRAPQLNRSVPSSASTNGFDDNELNAIQWQN
jgi:hypothetical protein